MERTQRLSELNVFSVTEKIMGSRILVNVGKMRISLKTWERGYKEEGKDPWVSKIWNLGSLINLN